MSDQNYKYDCALLVDDDSTDIYINKRILELSKFAKNIIVKKSCNDALNYLKQENMAEEHVPDVVFLDYFMPVQGGKEFLEHFEKLPDNITGRSKIVMLSVLDESMRPVEYDKQFVYNSIAKPLTEDKLEMIFNPSVSSEKNL